MRRALCGLVLLALALTGCRQDMYNQPKAKTYSKSDFFSDGTNARQLPAYTVEYHRAGENEALDTGLRDGVLLTTLPPPLTLTPELLRRGRERYDIYCAVCHGLTGEGNGEVVERGYPAPPTYHSAHLRAAPLGHFYDVIANGYGVMYSYASRVEPNDRWAIAAYLRALQLSRQAAISDLPPNERKSLETKP
ncbi:MAG: cytochrome c [Verrucomicrobiota bacterium]